MARVLGPTEYKAAARATRAPTRELHSDRQQSPSTTPDPETPMPLDEKSPIQGRDPLRSNGRVRVAPPLMVDLNILVAGLLTGAIYGLMALGLSVIFGVIRVVNFAHGEMMVAGMYVAIVLNARWGVDPLLALPLVAALLFAVGYLLQRGLINRLIDRPHYNQFLVLLAIAILF